MGYNNPLDTEDIIANTLEQESAKREQWASNATPQLAERVGQVHRNFPALPAGVKVALAKSGRTDEQIEAMYPTITNAVLKQSTQPKKKKGWFERNIGDKLKTASRYTFAGLNLPLDFVQGGLAQISDPNSSVAGWFISTDLGSLIANDEDAGSGFFIGGRAKELQAERARRYRGTINGQAWTIGRGLASTVFDPESRGYRYMSGAFDAAAALAVPTVPGAKAVKVGVQEAAALGKGGQAVQVAADVLDKFGKVSETIRPSAITPDEIAAARQTVLVGGQVDFKAANRWFGTAQARRVIERTAETNDFTEVWNLWGRKIDPDLALDLARESDPDLIRVRLLDELGQSQGLVSSKSFRGGNKTYLSLARREQFIQSLPVGQFAAKRVGRAFAQMPKREINLLQAESPIDKANQLSTLDSMMKLSLVPELAQRDFMERAANLMRTKDMAGIDIFNSDLDFVVRQSIIDTGQPKEIVDAIFDSYKKFRDEAQLNNIDDNYDIADAGLYERIFGGADPMASEVTFAGPQLASELARNHFYFPDVRQIRRLTASKPVNWIFAKQGKLGDPNIDKLRQAGELRLPFAAVSYFQEEIWRPMITATVGNHVRNTIDSQVMIALSHKPVSSLLRHPFQYLQVMRGQKEFADIFGRGFDEAATANAVSEAQEAHRIAVTEALTNQYKDPVTPWRKARRLGTFDIRVKDRLKTSGYGRATFARGHGDEIGKLNADWAARTLATGRFTIQDVIKMVRDGNPDAVKWFDSMKSYYGAGRKTFNRTTKEWGRSSIDLTNDFNLEALLDETSERLARITGNNDELLEIIAEGKLRSTTMPASAITTKNPKVGSRVRFKDGRYESLGEVIAQNADGSFEIRPFAFADGEVTRDLERLLASPRIFDDPNMPTRVVGEVVDPSTPINRQMKASFDTLIDMFHGNLYNKPIGLLERSPVFRELYYDWVDKLAVSLDTDSVNKIVDDITTRAAADGKSPENYVGSKVWKKLQDIQSGKLKNYGTITREELNAFASGQALDDMKMMFYNAAERRNATDAFRLISPFFQQQAEFLARLGRTAFTPVAGGSLGYLPRPSVLRKGQLVTNGVTEADPDQNGRGFVYKDPVSGGWTFTVPLSGEFTKLITGVESPINAPVKGLALGLDYRPGLGPMATLAVSEYLPDMPETDVIRNVLLPYGEREGLSETVLPSWYRKVYDGLTSNEGSGVFMNVYTETMQALAASGKYNTADPNERQQLFDDARKKAKLLTIIRGLSQFTGPAAGTLDQAVKAGELDVYASELAKTFQELRSADYDTAVVNFIELFGEDAFVYMGNKTKSLYGGLEASDAFGDYERRNKDLFSMYPDVAGYFGPLGTEFDFNVYQRQLSSGKRERLTPQETLAVAEQTIAMAYYRTMRANFGATLSRPEQQYLAQYRQALQTRYPGYAQMEFDPTKLPRQIEELGQAAQSSSLDGNEVAQAVRYYMGIRDQVMQVAASRGRSGISSQDTADLREYLSSYGIALMTKYPEFGRVYDRLLSKETEQ